jgi:hypothetical protein
MYLHKENIQYHHKLKLWNKLESNIKEENHRLNIIEIMILFEMFLSCF